MERARATNRWLLPLLSVLLIVGGVLTSPFLGQDSEDAPRGTSLEIDGTAGEAGEGSEPGLDGPELVGRRDEDAVSPSAARGAPISPETWQALWARAIGPDPVDGRKALTRIAGLHAQGRLDLARVLTSFLALESIPPATTYLIRGLSGNAWDEVFRDAAASDPHRLLDEVRRRSTERLWPALCLLTEIPLAEEHVAPTLEAIRAHRTDQRVLSAVVCAFEETGEAALPLVRPLLEALLDLHDAQEHDRIAGRMFDGDLVLAESWTLRDMLANVGADVVAHLIEALEPYKTAAEGEGAWQDNDDDLRGAICDALCSHVGTAARGIADLLAEGDQELRWHLLYRLGEGNDAHPEVVRDAIVAIARNADRDDNWIALSKLGNQGDDVRDLAFEMLGAERTLVRLGAATALARMGVERPESIDRLLPMLADKHHTLYGDEALDALLTAESLSHAQANFLMKALPTGVPDYDSATLAGLARLLEPHADALIPRLRGGHPIAFMILGHLDQPDDIHMLICKDHLQHRRGVVRIVATSLAGGGVPEVATLIAKSIGKDARIHNRKALDLALGELRRAAGTPAVLRHAVPTVYAAFHDLRALSERRRGLLGDRLREAFRSDWSALLRWDDASVPAQHRAELIEDAFRELDARGVAALREALDASDAELRGRATRILIDRRHSLPEGVALEGVLGPALEDEVPKTRLDAAEALIASERLGARALGVAFAFLRHADSKITLRVARILRGAWIRAEAEARHGLVQRLRRVARHPHKDTRGILEGILEMHANETR